MVAVMILNDKEIRDDLSNILNCDELPARIDFTKSVTNEQHRHLIQISRRNSIGYYFKLIISSFHGSSLEHQLPILEKYGFDVEVLVPAYTRLYCRWLKSTVIRGSLTDMPTIKNEQVIRH
jgi:hypothetical protein